MQQAHLQKWNKELISFLGANSSSTGESVHDVRDTVAFRSGVRIGSRRFPSHLQHLHDKFSFSVQLHTTQAVHRLQRASPGSQSTYTELC